MLRIRYYYQTSNWKIICSLINSESFFTNAVSENFLNICVLESFVIKNGKNRVKKFLEVAIEVLDNKYLRNFEKFDQRLKIPKFISYK